MRLSQVPNLRVEDFASEQSWIGRLFVQLNPFIQSVNQVFLNNVDYATNIKSVTKDFVVNAFQPFSFQWPFPETIPNDLRVIKAFRGTSQTPTILLASWDFNTTTSVVSVSRIVEVTESLTIAELDARYQFSIRVTV